MVIVAMVILSCSYGDFVKIRAKLAILNFMPSFPAYS